MKNNKDLDEQYAEYAKDVKNDQEASLFKESIIERRSEREKERSEQNL